MWFMNILQRLIFPPRTCRILTSAIWDETLTHTYLFWTLDLLTDHLCWKYQPSEKVEFWLKTLTKNSGQFSKPEKLMSNSFFLQKLIFAQKVAQVIRFQSLISDFSLDTSRTWFFSFLEKSAFFTNFMSNYTSNILGTTERYKLKISKNWFCSLLNLFKKLIFHIKVMKIWCESIKIKLVKIFFWIFHLCVQFLTKHFEEV